MKSAVALSCLVSLLMIPVVARAQTGQSPSEPLEADWRSIADDELLVMTLAGGKRVVVRLAPGYASEHVANVRLLARARWWDATNVYRVQDNWVAQWGDVMDKKPLPSGVAARPAAEYDFPARPFAQRLARSDAYSLSSGVTADGWPMATNWQESWVAHCYGTVGVAREASPDTGTGSELFVVIGGSARRLDRNYSVVGRVIEGMEHLSALPRGRNALGFYSNEDLRTPIVSIQLADSIPVANRPRYQYRAADNPRFAAMLERMLHPKPPTLALGGVDICDVPLEVRSRKAGT